MNLKRINYLVLGLTPLLITPIATTACATKTLSLNDRSIIKYLDRVKILSFQNIVQQFFVKNPDLQIIDKENELTTSRIEYNRAYIFIHPAFHKRSKYGSSKTTLYFDSYIWPLYDYEQVTHLTLDQPKSTFEFAITKDFYLEKFKTREIGVPNLDIETSVNQAKNILMVNVQIKKDKLNETQKTKVNFWIEEAGLPPVNIDIN